jgi:2'-5' RNA ligase
MFAGPMQNPRYALVAYVRNSVGEFVEKLRKELHPGLPHLAAHVTILPPRHLQGSESAARELLEEVCSTVEPFQIELDGVETFVPVTPTIFLRVSRAAYRMRELHDRLNTGVLSSGEEWPYMPHLTIAKLGAERHAEEAAQVAQERWAHYPGSRLVDVRELTFVREDEDFAWVDLAPVPLGRSLVSRQGK